ncbi:hypothetical protein ACFCXR_00040 [Streptomyces noursei]|uniref:hypothetical protein n=1 Tax=Streptomyces noursei TaxID=1971 RepID=UPI001F2CAF29|nr:hypothetical protein [Streptomyces noursei]MCE4946788.1 hypothetical protein [Streptomyces noursei]
MAGLLRRDVEAAAPAARHVVFDVGLDEVGFRDPDGFLGRLLACVVLGLAARTPRSASRWQSGCERGRGSLLRMRSCAPGWSPW